MTLSDYADAINAELVVRRYANQGERWIAHFDDCEVKEGGCLASKYGTGINANRAIADYVKRIEGKTIVFDAMTDRRRTFNVPLGIEP